MKSLDIRFEHHPYLYDALTKARLERRLLMRELVLSVLVDWLAERGYQLPSGLVQEARSLLDGEMLRKARVKEVRNEGMA